MGRKGMNRFSREVRVHWPSVPSASHSPWAVQLVDNHRHIHEANHQAYHHHDLRVTTSTTDMASRPGFHPRWDQYLVSRSTPATFFCAIFYVAICSILFLVYFWQFQTQPLHQAVSDAGIDTVFRDLKALPPRLPVTDSATDEKEKSVMILNSEGEVNATEPPLTSPALQPVEPKNWAGGGYESVPGYKPLRKHCGTCAVVSSSGHLKGSRVGAKIDNADCVIRMNAAPSLNYEADVGSRTTFRVIGHRNFPSMFRKEEEQDHHITNVTTKSDYVIVTWLYGVNIKKNTPYKMCHVLAKKYKDFVCYFGTEETMNRNLDIFYNELGISRETSKIKLWLSTGWTTLLFALEVCDSIDAYGMVYDGYCDEHPKAKTPYHYYDKVRSECSYYSRSERKTTGGHKFLTEKAIFGKWASIYNITFHRPSWASHLAERKNLSSSIDSPYKRIYHYLEWKKEHEDRANISKGIPVQANYPKPANLSIHNKFTAKKSDQVSLTADDKLTPVSRSNETMMSDNIVAFEVEGAGLVLVDRRTGKSAKGWTINAKTLSTKNIKAKVKNKPPAAAKNNALNSNLKADMAEVNPNLSDNKER